MDASLQNVVTMMDDMGIFSYLLSFFVMFAAYYGIIFRSRVFGEKTESIGLIIAAVAGLYTMYYVAQVPWLKLLFATVFTRIGVFLLIILFVSLVATISRVKYGEEEIAPNKTAVLFFSVAVVLLIFLTTAGSTQIIFGKAAPRHVNDTNATTSGTTSTAAISELSSINLGFFLVLLIMIIGVVFIVKPSSPSSEETV
jgi:hypothetical protein